MERSITPDATATSEREKEESRLLLQDREVKLAIQQEIFQEIVDASDPVVLHAVTEAAMRTAGSLSAAQKASIFGLVTSQTIEEARSREDAVARVLSEIVDLRMKKLENRMALMDDIEGLLEAERVALELERRDLYTARCRHWFGGT
jgi:SWI/SNF related-matrix-associated actin-dependent regulator of chromatin subfamily C